MTADQDTASTPTVDGEGAPDAGSAVEVVRSTDADTQIEHPDKLLRIAHMTRSLLNEVEATELDEAARERLTGIHNQAVDALRDLVSEDLRSELDDLHLSTEDSAPSGPELRVAQAQLAGWLQGLFQGIQASIMSQQASAQHQLQQMRQQRGGGSSTGQYL